MPVKTNQKFADFLFVGFLFNLVRWLGKKCVGSAFASVLSQKTLWTKTPLPKWY